MGPGTLAIGSIGGLVYLTPTHPPTHPLPLQAAAAALPSTTTTHLYGLGVLVVGVVGGLLWRRKRKAKEEEEEEGLGGSYVVL